MIMENFSLSDAYLIGNDLLDAQHKVILSYMAKIYTCFLSKKKKEELFELVDRLDAFCKLHFLEEEQVMDEMGFPEMDAHKTEHALFVTHLENFIGRYEELNTVKNIDELLFLKKWFLEHVAVYDKKYARYGKQ
jgi:hemerythrin-like metal-binding protein